MIKWARGGQGGGGGSLKTATPAKVAPLKSASESTTSSMIRFVKVAPMNVFSANTESKRVTRLKIAASNRAKERSAPSN